MIESENTIAVSENRQCAQRRARTHMHACILQVQRGVSRLLALSFCTGQLENRRQIIQAVAAAEITRGKHGIRSPR